MLSNQNLNDKIILITGAGDGMGRAASIEYASQGASVILLGKDVVFTLVVTVLTLSLK